MINRLFLPKNNAKIPVAQVVAIIKQLKIIHQLDCIYQGQVNSSYQKQGFGIQQTNDFNIYLGFWKCNKIHGLGMFIYPQGWIVYGNWKDNNLYGLAIIDDKTRLRIGIHHQMEIVGIGYDYTYQNSKWRLLKFHKGIPIDTISTVTSPIENGIPSMLNLHQDMHQLLSKYLSQKYFDCQNKNTLSKPQSSYTQMNVHKISSTHLYFGQIVDKRYFGLGLLYQKKKGHVIETGFYQNGQFHGYGLRVQHDHSKIQIGQYNKGKRQGFFYQKVNHLQKIVEYQQNYMRGQRPQYNKSKIDNNQKIFNYQKKDFFSEKNKINFNEYAKLFEKNSGSNLKSSVNLTSTHLIEPLNSTLYDKKSPRQQKKQSGSSKNISSTAKFQKTTVQVLRQKLGDIQKIIRRSKISVKDERQKGTKKILNVNFQLIVPNKQQTNGEMDSDRQIEDEYLPISKGKSKTKTKNVSFSKNVFPYSKKQKSMSNISPLKNRQITIELNEQKSNQQKYKSKLGNKEQMNKQGRKRRPLFE